MTTYTNEQIRGAILRAAERIEREPSSYKFSQCETGLCGTPLCMIGWIAHELGFKKRIVVNQFMQWLRTGSDPGHKWKNEHANELYGVCAVTNINYQHDPSAAAAGLRAYADRYYPAECKAVSTWVKQPTVSWRDMPWFKPAGVSSPTTSEAL